MSEQSSAAGSDGNEVRDRSVLRQERRARRRADRVNGGQGWLGGGILIGLGLLLLAQNSGYLTGFANWWALILLIPAVGSFSAAYGAFQRNDSQWTRESNGPLLAGVLLSGLAAVFLFNLNLSLFGPILLISAGVLLLGTR